MFFLRDAKFQCCSWEYYSVHRFRAGVAMELPIIRPYGAGSVVSCSLLIVRETIVMLSPEISG
jgi:hypothetical protein